MIVETNTSNSSIIWSQLAHNETETTQVGTKPVSFLTSAEFPKIITDRNLKPKILL